MSCFVGVGPSGPMSQEAAAAEDSAVPAEETSPLYVWLCSALQTERLAIAEQLEHRHCQLLEEYSILTNPTENSTRQRTNSDSSMTKTSSVSSVTKSVSGGVGRDRALPERGRPAAKAQKVWPSMDTAPVEAQSSPPGVVEMPIGRARSRGTINYEAHQRSASPRGSLQPGKSHSTPSYGSEGRVGTKRSSVSSALSVQVGPQTLGASPQSSQSSSSMPSVIPQSSISNTSLAKLSMFGETGLTQSLANEKRKGDDTETLRSQHSSELLEMRTNEHFERQNIFRNKSFQPDVHWTTRLATSPLFEGSFGLLIFSNAVVMALECQYKGFDLGHDIQYPKFERTSADTWPGMAPAFVALDFAFGVVFGLEVIIKLVGLRRDFAKDWFNLFDMAIILGWILDVSTRHLVVLPLDTMFLRSVRLFRLLRLLRLLGTICRMDALFVMVISLRSSVNVLFWVSVMLVILLTLCAFFVNQIVVTSYLEADPAELDDIENRRIVFKYFGTFERSMLTMFELTLANWAPVAWVLQEHVSEWFLLFAIAHKLTIGFAVVSVVNGVFMQETFKCAAMDDNILVWQKLMAHKMHIKKMEAFVNMADASGDGALNFEEFSSVLKHEQVSMWLAGQGLEEKSPEILFTLLDLENKGVVSVDDIVNGVSRLKGAARSIDLVKMQYFYEHLQLKVDGICQGVDEILARQP